MYRIIRPGEETLPSLPIRLAHIADRAWRGYSRYDLNWRLKYYAQLFQYPQANSLFRLVEYHNEHRDELEDCAFVCILPMKADIYDLHAHGQISQYNFQSKNLEIHTRSRRVKSHHYFQSLFVDPTHREVRQVKVRVRDAILELLKAQRCGYRGRPYVIYAETSLLPGRQLCLSQGLLPTSLFSAESNPFYEYDSEKSVDQLQKVATAIESLWAKSKQYGVQPDPADAPQRL